MEDNKTNEERRSFPRIPKAVTVEVIKLLFPLPTKPDSVALGKDISGGGISFTSDMPFDIGSSLSLKIHLKGLAEHRKPHSYLVDIAQSQPLAALGEVVWCRPSSESGRYDVGLHFTNIYEDDFKALMQYLESS
jgi:hypothetical protein